MLWRNTNAQEMSPSILLWIKGHISSRKDSKTAQKHIFPIGRKSESSKNRIRFSVYILNVFLPFLKKRNISSLNTLSLKDILDFMTSLDCYEKPTINHTMRAVRYYLKYCYENDFMEKEMFSKFPNPHYNRQSRLPSSYSADEVTKLLDSIDLGNPCGIRDYAIILLIARLGLRSSDVANLRFSNIDWEKEALRLTQVKTGNPLELPLLEDVGGAIINYLKNARSKTDSDHVFVRQVPIHFATALQAGCWNMRFRFLLFRKSWDIQLPKQR